MTFLLIWFGRVVGERSGDEDGRAGRGGAAAEQAGDQGRGVCCGLPGCQGVCSVPMGRAATAHTIIRQSKQC